MFPSFSVSVVTQVPAVFCHTGYCLSLYPHLSSPQRMEIMGGGMVLWRGPRVHAKDWYVDLQRLDTVNTPPEPHHRGRPAKLTWRKIQLAFFPRPQQIQARAQQLKWHRQGFISHTHTLFAFYQRNVTSASCSAYVCRHLWRSSSLKASWSSYLLLFNYCNFTWHILHMLKIRDYRQGYFWRVNITNGRVLPLTPEGVPGRRSFLMNSRVVFFFVFLPSVVQFVVNASLC